MVQSRSISLGKFWCRSFRGFVGVMGKPIGKGGFLWGNLLVNGEDQEAR